MVVLMADISFDLAHISLLPRLMSLSLTVTLLDNFSFTFHCLPDKGKISICCTSSLLARSILSTSLLLNAVIPKTLPLRKFLSSTDSHDQCLQALENPFKATFTNSALRIVSPTNAS